MPEIHPRCQPLVYRSSTGRVFRTVALVVVAVALLLPALPAEAQTGPDDSTSKGAPPATDESATGPPAKAGPTLVVREILFPVVGKVNFTDTWGACRSGCTRTHKGVDIFGTKLAPLVAVADGTIVSVRRSALTNAGNAVTIRDDEGWYYLYLHVNNDSPGTDDGANPQAWILPNRLRVGDRVQQGDVVAYLGDSGNAETTPAHLHFEIHQPGVGAVNPTPSVQAAKDTGRVRPVASLASTSEDRAQYTSLITAWYRALLKRAPTSKELIAWSDRFAIGFADRADLIADLTMAPQRRNPTGTVLRSFRVVLGRRPEATELRQWEGQYKAGARAAEVATGLLASSEFTGKGELSDAQFVDLIYRQAKGMTPSASVRQYWLDQIAGGRTRASMAAYFIESFAVKDSTWHELEVMLAYRAALDREPTDAEVTTWRKQLDNGALLPDVVAAIKG
jgi:Peptidase family M23/Domain of unknown function (DUF4214)